MSWEKRTNQTVIDWLLEDDMDNPSISYFAKTDLFDEKPDSISAIKARKKLMAAGPVPKILSNQNEEGYWVEPGSGYQPKYTSTVWSLIMLSQLGADPTEKHVRKACGYVLGHARTEQGFFSVTATQTGAVHCLQGNLASALLDFGMQDDPRLAIAIDWMARSVTGEGFGTTDQKEVKPHYIRSGISGPGFLCSANDHQACAWGAVKVAMAFSKIPEEMRTPEINAAINECKTFLMSKNPSTADYPHPYATNPSGSWFKFGFPIFYVTDLLQNISSLLGLGLGGDPRLQDAVDLIESKQDDLGRWTMDYTYNGKTWVDIEEKGQPSKWVTYRALSVIKKFYSL